MLLLQYKFRIARLLQNGVEVAENVVVLYAIEQRVAVVVELDEHFLFHLLADDAGREFAIGHLYVDRLRQLLDFITLRNLLQENNKLLLKSR